MLGMLRIEIEFEFDMVFCFGILNVELPSDVIIDRLNYKLFQFVLIPFRSKSKT